MSPEMPDRKDLGRYVALSQIGMEMAAPIGIGVLLDHYFDWTPWATIAGAVLGLCGGFVHLVHMLNRMDASESSPSDRETR